MTGTEALIAALFASTAATTTVGVLNRPKAPPPPVILPAPEVPTRDTSVEIQDAARKERARRAGALGRRSTVLGGAVGGPGVVQRKTLLGE